MGAKAEKNNENPKKKNFEEKPKKCINVTEKS